MDDEIQLTISTIAYGANEKGWYVHTPNAGVMHPLPESRRKKKMKKATVHTSLSKCQVTIGPADTAAVLQWCSLSVMNTATQPSSSPGDSVGGLSMWCSQYRPGVVPHASGETGESSVPSSGQC